MDKDHFLMQDSQGQELELWSTKAGSKILKLCKQGDTNFQDSVLCDGYIAFTDAKSTNIFHFDESEM
jgi:hypothetical protein